MRIRKTKLEDVPSIMRIVGQAQEYFRSQGIDQWQNGYPTEKVFFDDIQKEMSYVIEEEERVVGTFAFAVAEEPCYKIIHQGEWGEEGIYAILHRVAMENEAKGNGLGGKMVEYASKECMRQKVGFIRVDTHRDNKSMQRMLAKSGFVPKGIIYLQDGAERVAFEKSLAV